MKDAVREIVESQAKLRTPVRELGDAGDLFGAGTTSLNIVTVMLALEGHFDVEFPQEKLNRQTFGSIDAMCAALSSLGVSG